MAKGDDIEERLLDFAVSIIQICDTIPNSPAGRHTRGQLLRSGTSPAPNYAEARSAESKRDFVHKLKIVLKELNESRVWLKMIKRSKLLEARLVSGLLNECEQLCRIISSSIETAKRNEERRRNN